MNSALRNGWKLSPSIAVRQLAKGRDSESIQGSWLEAHWKSENVWQLAEAVEHKCNDCKGDVCAQDAKRSNADKIAEELLLLDGKPSVENNWR